MDNDRSVLLGLIFYSKSSSALTILSTDLIEVGAELSDALCSFRNSRNSVTKLEHISKRDYWIEGYPAPIHLGGKVEMLTIVRV